MRPMPAYGRSLAGEFFRPVVMIAGVAAAVGGLGYVVLEAIGAGDCGRAMLTDRSFGNLASECFPKIEQESKGEMTITGPEKLEERLVDDTLYLSFGQAEMTMRYPKNEDGKLTKVDWKEGFGDFVIDGTRFVEDTPFVVAYTPCAKLGENYTNIEVGADVAIPASNSDEVESEFRLEFVKDDPLDPNRITRIIAHTGALAACAVHVPTETADGENNRIPFKQSNRVNNGVAATFDFIVTDLAVEFGAATACPEKILEMEEVASRMDDYVTGAISNTAPNLQGIPVDVQMANPEGPRQHFMGRYNAEVAAYDAAEKSLFPDTDGDYKDMDIKFSDGSMIETTEC